MERQVWTDERLDDMVARNETRFDAFQLEMREFRAEMREFRAEMVARFDRMDDRFDRMDDRFDRMDDRFDRLRGQMFQAVLVLTSAMVATMVTIIAKTL